MKKIALFFLAVVLLFSVLTACSFTTNQSNSAGQMRELDKVNSMLSSLSTGDISSAKALLHPEVSAEKAESLVQMQEYLNGRKVIDVTQQNWNVSTSTGLGGTVRQEKASFQITLDDSTVCYLSVCYVTENQAQGFLTFQLVLGLV